MTDQPLRTGELCSPFSNAEEYRGPLESADSFESLAEMASQRPFLLFAQPRGVVRSYGRIAIDFGLARTVASEETETVRVWIDCGDDSVDDTFDKARHIGAGPFPVTLHAGSLFARLGDLATV